MPSFSSISLANAKVKYALFAAAYLLAIFLYWPSFKGLPVWDDLTFWFYDPVMLPSYSYTDVWLRFTWPLSVTIQKVLLNLIGENWWVYHALSFIVHGFNSWLVYRLMRLLMMGQKSAFLGFLFFLIHPASVITVAWMIQLKTLICFSFALGSIIFFIRARRPVDYAISVSLFILSILCKSSSLPLPLVLLFFLGKNWKTKKVLTLIPYILVSIYGYYRLTNSEVALKGIESATKVASVVVKEVTPVAPPSVSAKGIPETTPGSSDETQQMKVEKKLATTVHSKTSPMQEGFRPPPDEPLAMNSPAIAPGEVNYKEAPKWEAPVEPTLTNADDSRLLAHARLFVKTLYYYFWQGFLPIENAPVKGLNPFPPTVSDYLHILFLGILILLVWGTNLLAMLIAGHIFLLPYLGIIPAPYMNVTWVSDQHLYLALPCFILFFIGMVKKVKPKWFLPPLAFLLIFFAYETRKASHLYLNNFVFYEASINANYNNIPLIYNLSILYVMAGRQNDAMDLIESIMSISEEEPFIKDNRFYPFLIHLYSQMNRQ